MSNNLKYLFHLLAFPFLYIKYRILILFDINKSRDDYLECSTLIISHDLGGGTAKYLDSFRTKDAVIIKNIEYIWHICYKVEIADQHFYITDNKMKKIISKEYNEIIINSFVKMRQIFSLMPLFINIKKMHPHIKLLYLVHDYHAVCPNFNLIRNNTYCGLICQNCNYIQPIVFGSKKKVDIIEWRKQWETFLENCDEILCFSNSSKNIICSVYPLITDKVIVKPHEVLPIPGKYILNDNIVYKVGFFGTINNGAKGLYQTREILSQIDNNINVCFVGSKAEEIGIKRNNIQYLGRYSHNQLIDIINTNNISLAVFPSVVPETFSFLVSELIMIGIPILGFDIGAQGEKIKEYSKGTVFDSWEEMVKFINGQFEK